MKKFTVPALVALVLYSSTVLALSKHIDARDYRKNYKVYTLKDSSEIYNHPENIRSLEISSGGKFSPIYEYVITHLYTLMNLEVLDFADCNVPSDFKIHQLPKVKFLSIANTKIECKSFLESFPSLEFLSFDCKLTDFNSLNISKLKKIKFLGFTNAKKFPINATNLTSLTDLHVEYTDIDSLPVEISNLFNLRYFYMYNTPIRMLPKSMSRLKNLVQLNIEQSHVASIPESMYVIKNLKVMLSAGCDCDYGGGHFQIGQLANLLRTKPKSWDVGIIYNPTGQ